MKQEQYRRGGLALVYLAKKFLTYDTNSRIPTIEEFCEDSGFSRGTIQAALKKLKDANGVFLESHGHLGTYLAGKNYKQLIQFTDTTNFTIAMPLPYTKKYEGLGTGIYREFHRDHLNVSIVYLNGSLRRLQGLKSNHFNFIIVSKLAAKQIMIKDKGYTVAKELGIHTFLSDHVIAFRDGIDKIQDGLVVGVDKSSIDYMLLSEKLFKGFKIHVKNIVYNQTMDLLKQKKIDVAVWNKDEIEEKHSNLQFQTLPFDVTEESSTAVLLMKKEENYLTPLLNNVVDWEKIRHTQNGVELGKILPEY